MSSPLGNALPDADEFLTARASEAGGGGEEEAESVELPRAEGKGDAVQGQAQEQEDEVKKEVTAAPAEGHKSRRTGPPPRAMPSISVIQRYEVSFR